MHTVAADIYPDSAPDVRGFRGAFDGYDPPWLSRPFRCQEQVQSGLQIDVRTASPRSFEHGIAHPALRWLCVLP
jgi:hypothetical protein